MRRASPHLRPIARWQSGPLGQRVTLTAPNRKDDHELRRPTMPSCRIGTVLVDEPQLTVRLVSGPNPQPVVWTADCGCRSAPPFLDIR